MGLLWRFDVVFPVLWTGRHAVDLAKEIGLRHPKLRSSFSNRTREEQVVRGEKFLKAHRNVSATKALTPLTRVALTDVGRRRRLQHGLPPARKRLLLKALER